MWNLKLKVASLVAASKILAKIGDLDKALRYAYEIVDTEDLPDFLISVAEGVDEIGEKDQATKVLNETITAIDKLKNHRSQSRAFGRLAEAFAKI